MLNNIEVISEEIKWLEKIIRVRIEFANADLRNFDITKVGNANTTYSNDSNEYNLSAPSLQEYKGKYAEAVKTLSFEERLILILPLAFQLSPGLIESQLSKSRIKTLVDRNATFFTTSGLTLKNNSGLIPTGAFYIYLFAGVNLSLRVEIISKIYFDLLQPLNKQMVGIMRSNNALSEPLYSGQLIMDEKLIYDLIIDPTYNTISSFNSN